MGYLFLALAIIGEVIATTFLKFTAGENAKATCCRSACSSRPLISYLVFHEGLTLTQLVGSGRGLRHHCD
jgi:multidrug transporter EmrE-like cation transporter